MAKHLKSHFHLLGVSCLAAIIAAPAIGQEDEDRSSVGTAIEEIIITTERREQSLLDVPLSITAFGDKKRDTVGILSIQDMANFAPGVSFNMSTDRPTIRGVGRQSNFYTIDSPVANYVDGVYTSTVQDAQRRPIYIERTEILRGPQGALSGRGSVAGAFNTISKRPSDEFEAEVRSYTREYAQYGVEGTVTGPLTDWLRARLNLATYHQDDGFFENVSTGHWEGDQPNNRDIADLHLSVDLADNIEWYTKIAWVDYLETRRTGNTTAPFVAGVQNNPTPYGPDSSTLTPLASWGYFDPNGVSLAGISENPVITTGDERKFASDLKSRQQLVDDYKNFTSHLTWQTDTIDVEWIAGYQNYHYADLEDLDNTDIVQMTLPTGRVVSPGGTEEYSEDRKWFSNEITFTSTTDSDIQWIVGLFESNEETFQQPATFSYPGYDELAAPAMSLDAFLSLFPPAFGIPFNPDGIRFSVPENPGNRTVYSIIDVDTVSTAIFGQIDYQYSEEWKFTLGLRYNEDSKDVMEAERLVANGLGDDLGDLLAGSFIAVDVTPVFDPNAELPPGVVRDRGIDPVTGYRVRDLKEEWTATTGSIGVDYTPNPDALIYFRAAVGYRPGGFNAGFINPAPLFDKETVYSYEVGYKGTLRDDLQVSASAFYYDFRDNQQPLPTLGRCTDTTPPIDLTTCTTINSFVNLPESENIGLELELTYAPIDNLSFYLTYGYLDATVKEGLVNGIGFSNSNDPAAILPSANRHQLIPGQFDTGFTGLPRYTQDISGNKLASSPEHKVALNGNYTFGFQSGDLTLSASYIWRDDQYTDLFETELAKVDSFSTIGARAIWNDFDNRYTVILAIENITDEEAGDNAGVTRQRTGLTGVDGAAYYRTYNLSPPRVWSAEFQYRFGN